MSSLGNPEGVRRLVQVANVDAIIAMSLENVAYISGHIVETQRFLPDRLSMVLWPKGAEPTLIVTAVDEAQVKEESWIHDVRSYVEFKTSPVTMMTEIVKERGLEQSTIALEFKHTGAQYTDALRISLPNVRFVPVEPLLSELRAQKTPEEIRNLQVAAIGTEKALLATFATIQTGDREGRLRTRLIQNMLQCGADFAQAVSLHVGINTGGANKAAGLNECKKGDLVKAIAGASWGGYASDLGRMAVIGKPSPHQADIWARLWDVHAATIDSIRPGRTTGDVYDGAFALMAKANLPFSLPHVGWSIGLGIYEHPILSPFASTEIEPDMTFVVETRVRWFGTEGYHVEDLVRTTRGAPEWLSGQVLKGNDMFQI